jgi:hypothetical protein
MRHFTIAAGLAFAVSTMPVLPASAQYLPNPGGAPAGGGGSGGGVGTGYPIPLVNSFGKCWIDTDGNPRWDACPHAEHKGGHHKG